MKHNKFFLLQIIVILFAGLLCSAESMGRNTCTLNIGSFNISYDNKKEEVGWEYRKESVASLIRFHEWDVFGTQEGQSYLLEDIAGEEYDYVFANGFFNQKNPDIDLERSQHNGIFWLKNKFELLDTGSFWLSETPDVKSFGWDAAESRGCVWVKLKERNTNITFFFFCVHFDHRGVIARQNSALLVLNKIQEIAIDFPVFCVGDFNGSADAEHIQTMKANGLLYDSYDISQSPPYGTKGTSNQYKKDSAMDQRIDYIWVTEDIEVKKFGVLNEMPYNRFTSDHFPIMIKAEL
ncbi:MAG: endonuclease/exonuclease/phosphatase family protein [Dysgonamonadaceae bacterium]